MRPSSLPRDADDATHPRYDRPIDRTNERTMRVSPLLRLAVNGTPDERAVERPASTRTPQTGERFDACLFFLFASRATRCVGQRSRERDESTDGLWFCVPRCATRAIGDVRDA